MTNDDKHRWSNQTMKRTVIHWFHHHGFGYLLIGLWVLVNVIIFTVYYLYYQNAVEYLYLRQFVGKGLPLARASAACINFNSFLVILPVCRNFLLTISTAIRCGYKMSYELWKNRAYHKLFARGIIFFSALHVYAHCWNYTMLYGGHFSHDSLISILTNFPSFTNETSVNPISSSNYGVVYQALKTIPAITGIILVVILALILSSSTELIRRSYYEVFWFSHHLFIMYYIFLIIHGIQGIIRKQINLNHNDPYVCSKHPEEWKPGSQCHLPNFKGTSPETWKWILLPLVLYFIERCIRFARSWQTVTIVKVIRHPASVLEIQLRQPGFTFNTGQYIYLHCPIVSKLEWHPFTLTSGPNEPNFSIHIRKAGDWTEKLIRKFSAAIASSGLQRFPRLAVDGPYGSPSERIFLYKKVVLIGAGIGVTPFASVLKSFLYSEKESYIENVHFYWLCSKPQAFEWFANFLKALETQLMQTDRTNLIQYHIYLTRGWDMDQVWKIFLHDRDEVDVITGFKQRTNFGRPNWDKIFPTLQTQFKDNKIGVFYCGPKELADILSAKCKFYSKPGKDSTKFHFHKEKF